jgi:membrane-bound serine protease (ClpP class)
VTASLPRTTSDGSPRRERRLLAGLSVLLGLALLGVGTGQAAVDDAPVHLVHITGEIDRGLAPYLDRTLADAASTGAAAVVVRIDTPGGRLDAVLEMRDSLLASPVRTVAFVDRTALSAGALIALASHEVHMAPGGVIGAATPVLGTGQPADPKVVSAVRSIFRSTALERGRDPAVAEAMVDPAIAVEGLIGTDELLTLTTSEALEWGVADALVADIDGVLTEAGLAGRAVIDTAPSLAERLVRFVTNPVLASLLMMVGVWLIVGDLLSGGGMGLGVGVGASMIAVFFWGHLLAGLAGWEDVALVVLGVVLLLVELFVLPGFGIAGVLGLVAIGGGTFLAMLNRDLDFVSTNQMLFTGAVVAVAFVGVAAGTIGLVASLARRRGPDGIVLRARLGGPVADRRKQPAGWLRWFGQAGGVLASDRRNAGEHPPEEAERGALTGATGVALSDLHPAGIADLDGRRVDVVSAGEYIAAGQPIEVIADEGYRRVVRRRGTGALQRPAQD